MTRHAWSNPVTKKALQRIGDYINKDLPGFVDLFSRFDDRAKGHLLLNEVRQPPPHRHLEFSSGFSAFRAVESIQR